MKILQVLQTMAPSYGGPVQALKTYARWLAEAGHDVTIVTTNADYPRGRISGPVNEAIQEQGYEIRRFPVSFSPYVYSPALGHWLRKHISEFDVVHIHGIYRYPPIAAARAARRSGVPYIMRTHGTLDPFIFNKAERRKLKRLHEHLFDFPALNGAKFIHFTAEDERRLVEPLGLRARSAIIPVGIDPTPFSVADHDGEMRKRLGINDRPMILFFGRLTPKKGLDISIKAFARVKAKFPDAVFVIAGPDNENFTPNVERWLGESNIRDSTILLGMTSGKERIGLLRDADVFVLQSYTENFGISVVEAIAAGTPVVISNNVNLWPDVEHYNAGLVTPCDPEAAAQAIVSVLEKPELRRTLVEGGKRLLDEKYGKKVVTAQLLSLYQQAISDKIS